MCARVHTHCGALLSHSEKETLLPATVWTDLEGLCQVREPKQRRDAAWPHSHMEPCQYSELAGRAKQSQTRDADHRLVGASGERGGEEHGAGG